MSVLLMRVGVIFSSSAASEVLTFCSVRSSRNLVGTGFDVVSPKFLFVGGVVPRVPLDRAPEELDLGSGRPLGASSGCSGWGSAPSLLLREKRLVATAEVAVGLCVAPRVKWLIDGSTLGPVTPEIGLI